MLDNVRLTKNKTQLVLIAIFNTRKVSQSERGPAIDLDSTECRKCRCFVGMMDEKHSLSYNCLVLPQGRSLSEVTCNFVEV